jgi:hypothetical protein
LVSSTHTLFLRKHIIINTKETDVGHLGPALWKLNFEDAVGLSIFFFVDLCRVCLLVAIPVPSTVFVNVPSF